MHVVDNHHIYTHIIPPRRHNVALIKPHKKKKIHVEPPFLEAQPSLLAKGRQPEVDELHVRIRARPDPRLEMGFLQELVRNLQLIVGFLYCIICTYTYTYKYVCIYIYI